jgi:hypothetical protein
MISYYLNYFMIGAKLVLLSLLYFSLYEMFLFFANISLFSSNLGKIKGKLSLKNY